MLESPQRTTVSEEKFLSFKENLRDRGNMNFRIASGSMAPLIQIGDEIEVSLISKPLKRFDIIVFLSESILVCHFLWHINRLSTRKGEWLYITKPLFPKNAEDWPFPEKQILGIVTSHRLTLWMRMKIVFSMLKRK